MSDKESMRDHVRLHYGIKVPDEAVVDDTPDYFSYRSPKGLIVGWNRNVETFWRNRDTGDEDGS